MTRNLIDHEIWFTLYLTSIFDSLYLTPSIGPLKYVISSCSTKCCKIGVPLGQIRCLAQQERNDVFCRANNKLHCKYTTIRRHKKRPFISPFNSKKEMFANWLRRHFFTQIPQATETVISLILAQKSRNLKNSKKERNVC